MNPATLLKFHRALKARKYRWLFASQRSRKPGPKGPSPELIQAIVEMKRRNPHYGCPRIAQQLSAVFDVEINKDVVRRALATHYQPAPDTRGPSWLTFLGHTKDSLWSIDFFRCESIILQTHWVLVVMDQFTRRIIGFGVHRGEVDGRRLNRECAWNALIEWRQKSDFVDMGGFTPQRVSENWARVWRARGFAVNDAVGIDLADGNTKLPSPPPGLPQRPG